MEVLLVAIFYLLFYICAADLLPIALAQAFPTINFCNPFSSEIKSEALVPITQSYSPLPAPYRHSFQPEARRFHFVGHAKTLLAHLG